MRKDEAPPKDGTARARQELTGARPEPLPSAHLPGTEGKVRDIAGRVRRGLECFGKSDASEDFEYAKLAAPSRNGKPRLAGVVRDRDVSMRPRGGGKASASADEVFNDFRSKSVFTPGSRIRWLRLRERLSVKALACRSGVSRVTLLRIEGGRFLPNVYTAIRIADGLRVSLDYLFGRKAPGPA